LIRTILKEGVSTYLAYQHVSFQKGKMPDDAVEALAGSLGKREADPEDGKPAVDKVKVMAAQGLPENDYH
jgi:hypothetical protein